MLRSCKADDLVYGIHNTFERQTNRRDTARGLGRTTNDPLCVAKKADKKAKDNAVDYSQPLWVISKQKYFGKEKDYEFFLQQEGQQLLVGREVADEDMLIPLGTVSGEHVLFEVAAAGQLTVTDLDSTNGTLCTVDVFGQPTLQALTPGEPVKVTSGASVVLADEQSGAVLRVLRIDPQELRGEEEEAGEAYAEEEEEQVVAYSGRALSVDTLSLEPGMIGDGSFGQVFYGTLEEDDTETAVVLKRSKVRVSMANESLETELELNHRVSERSPGACAEYIGHCWVGAGEGGPIYNGELDAGLWLVWEFEGERTLDSFVGTAEDFTKELAAELGMGKEVKKVKKEERELVVVRRVMRSLLCNIAALHKERFVHRDVKPDNLLVTPGSVKLLDLGGTVDLKDGTNYDPEVCIRDPLYCPPELEIIPEDAVQGWDTRDVKKNTKSLKKLWKEYNPETFDVYCAGVVLMQMGVRSLRGPRMMETFNQELSRAGHNLDRWRDDASVADDDCTVLNANGGAGWELAKLLLQKAAWNGGRSQADGGRPSAETALKHRFFKKT